MDTWNELILHASQAILFISVSYSCILFNEFWLNLHCGLLKLPFKVLSSILRYWREKKWRKNKRCDCFTVACFQYKFILMSLLEKKVLLFFVLLSVLCLAIYSWLLICKSCGFYSSLSLSIITIWLLIQKIAGRVFGSRYSYVILVIRCYLETQLHWPISCWFQ